MRIAIKRFVLFKPSSVTYYSNILYFSVINSDRLLSFCHFLSLFTGISAIFWLKTVTLQALLCKSHYDKRMLTRKQTILHLPTNYQKSAFKLKIAKK